MKLDWPVDYSQLSLFYRCPMLWKFRYVDALDLPTHPSASWSKHLIHKPLELWWTQGDWDWDPLWQKYMKDRKDVLDPFYTMELAQTGVRAWLERFPREKEEYEFVAAEGVVPVPQVPGFVTKPDLVVRRRRDGKLLVKDFKTSRYEKDALIFDRQFLGQVLGYGADGFSRDFFLLKSTKKDGISVEVMRDEVEVPKDLLEEWIEETKLGMEFMRTSLERGVFPKNAPDACYPFPRIRCEMMDACGMGRLRGGMIERMEKRDPLSYLKE